MKKDKELLKKKKKKVKPEAEVELKEVRKKIDKTTSSKKVISRHEDMSDVERKALRLKRQLKQQNKVFRQAQKLNRPRLNKTKSLQEFGEYADDTAKKLSELTLRVMSLQTAFNYAESMINSDIEAAGVEWQTDAAFKIADKIQVVETTRIMLKHFGISKALTNVIMNQTILKQFGVPAGTSTQLPMNPNPGVPTFTGNDIKKVLEEYGKDISKGRP